MSRGDLPKSSLPRLASFAGSLGQLLLPSVGAAKRHSFPDVASAKEIISVGAMELGNVALLTWMSQEVSTWLVSGLQPTYKWDILRL